MKIKSLSEIIIPELPSRGSGDYLKDLNLNLYTGEPLLTEAHELEKMAFPFPNLGKYKDCNWSSTSWHGCDIFGWKYTCGRINGMSPDKLDKMWKQYFWGNLVANKSVEKCAAQSITLKTVFYKDILRPLQSAYLKKLQKSFFSYDIIASLLALGIDPVKFWYAMLWLMDFINDRTDDVWKFEQIPLEGLSAMSKQLKGLHEDEFLALRDKGELTLKIGDAHRLKITNVDTLKILGKIINEYLLKCKNQTESIEYLELISKRCLFEDTSSDNIFEWKEKREGTSHLMKVYLFHKYMKEYLSNYNGKRNLCIVDLIEDAPQKFANNKASIDKELLISRLICCINDYGDKNSFYNDNKAIKSALRKFNPTKVMPHFYIF